MREAFFFSPQQLFGIYYPASDVMSDRLIVICAPFFEEYQRTYRALAELSEALAQNGVHVLRFDYRGTGESFGELSDVKSCNEWCEDISSAIDEGVALSGATQVSLLGVRFGANLAASIIHEDLNNWIFWDPLSSGSGYCSVLDQNKAWLKNTLQESADYTGSAVNIADPEMFSMCESLEESIKIYGSEVKNGERTVQILSKGHNSGGLLGVGKTIQSHFEYAWPAFEDGLLRPRDIQESIINVVQEFD